MPVSDWLSEAFSQVLCLAADGAQKVKAAQLYDPSNALLATVFEGENVFPAPAFASPDWLKVRALPAIVPQQGVYLTCQQLCARFIASRLRSE